MKQTVAHKKVKPLEGILLVLGIAAVLILFNYVVLDYLAVKLGSTAASVCFWVVGGLMVLWILKVYVVSYTYELTGNVLRLTRSYGKRQRFIEDIYLNRVMRIGETEELKKKYPSSKVVRALQCTSKMPVTAIAFKNAKGDAIALIQAEERLKAKLIEAVKAN